MNPQTILSRLADLNRFGLGAPLLLMVMLSMMVLPLPPFLLDTFFTFNITLSLIVMLAVIYSKRPLDFAVFPTILLVATLLRLSLNVASTRVVLLHGHTGEGAAGKVIAAFGDFVVGGNYTVGFVVFIVLVIINFVVITKGAGRISEVSARFTLDAMPGKQMAIDADLNAGMLTQEEAKTRREEVAQEADFYGSMDGASKFVRGDAIAGILILIINLVGGLAIGTTQHGMPMAEAGRVFSLLTIGDGLVAQIPSLVLSTASGIMVTRVNNSRDMGQQILAELFADPRALGVSAAIIGILGMIPGMPNFVFLLLAVVTGGGAWLVARQRRLPKQQPDDDALKTVPEQAKELSWDDVPPVDMVGLEIGYRLISMVDKTQGGELLGRLKGVRKKLSQELGFLLPQVHIRDNLDLPPTAYRVILMGATIAQHEVAPDKELAINPGQVFGSLDGTPTIDPVFGLEATWIDPAQREKAQSLGFTVVDTSTVIATNLSQILQDNAKDLLGHDDVQQLLDRLARSHPKLVEDLVPKVLPLTTVVKVLQNLLRENVAINDMRTIVQVLAECAGKSQEPGILTAATRIALGRTIIEKINGLADELPVITMDQSLEQLLHQTMQSANEGGIVIEPGLANDLLQAIRQNSKSQELLGQPTVILVSDMLREFLARFVRQSMSTVHILGFSEIPENTKVKIVASIGGANALEPAALGA